ncbi:hypothetical protein IVB30_15530 [Bradyrhizobium sp. 200]|uniref:hypothetical protein n=1 Tax=Bradyrhizobium sp. 200 TaxID=2782665 RepID=UPI001FFF4847|nr:hypothetical protein [Bradyrhizobium sp. 200]UPJ52622.1 hypothetical protein IVB30_15530 [Bradyrhizobium sp. 200]
MPITIDLDKNPFLRGMVEHVRKDCTIENIGLVLRARFGRALPDELKDRLRQCPHEELDELLCRCAVAPTLEETLMVRLSSAIAAMEAGRASAHRNSRED